MSRARILRVLLIATPFVLLAVGGWALATSPWPAIWGLMLRGQHVVVTYRWDTLGRAALAAVCFLGALAISFTIRRRETTPSRPSPPRRRR